jgi:spermidine synthase
MKLNRNHILFLIILIEGYVVLASELLAMRLMTSFVGSGIEVIAIIISCVLLPLAVGYHVGGSRYATERRKRKKKSGQIITIRTILLQNLVVALFVIGMGLSYGILTVFFNALMALGITSVITLTSLYGIIFLVYPTFLLAQTVPLISNYFSTRSLSEITGKMLFFSTTGSFLGSVLSTIVLMTTIGVHNTVIITLGLLASLVALLSKRIFNANTIIAFIFFAGIIFLNCGSSMAKIGILSNNNYNTAMIKEVPADNARILVLNGGASSQYSTDPSKRFPYLKYIESIFLNHLPKEGERKDILVIGAGGFTFGIDDSFNNYHYIDIDPDLKEISETHFLKKPIGDNKRFTPSSARAFLKRETQTYDIIFVDVFTNVISIPFEATTKEFLEDVKALLKKGGVIIVNVISSPNFNDKFTVRYYNTFRSVFPVFDRHVIGDFNALSNNAPYENTLYFYYDNPFARDNTIYTDDKNTYSLDRQ